MQRFGVAIGEYRQRFVRLTSEPSGFGARVLQADHCGIGRFLCSDVFAGALAQYLGRLCHIENVVDDLESQPEPVSKVGNRAQFFRICVCPHCAEPDGSFQHGGGFVLVDITELVEFDVLAFGFDIGNLTGN